MEQIKIELIKEIKHELFHYPETTKKQDIKYIIKRILKPKDTPKRDSFFWTHAMLAQALESVEEVNTLKKYYDKWIEKGLPVYNLDNIMNGYSLLYVFEKTGEEKYRQAADKLYEYICNYAEQLGNPLPYRKNHPTHVYVDGLGMIVPFLCRYGTVFKKQEAVELGIRQVREFFKYGMDEVTGLPYHGYDTATQEKQGIIGWGRAVGWLMLAVADSLEYLPEGKEKEELKEAFYKLTKASFEYYRKDGYFSWQLSAVEGPKDTSATAMIGYAVKKVFLILENDFPKGKAVEEKNGNCLEEFVVCGQNMSLETAINGLQKAILNSSRNGKIYDCSGECEGFSRYPQVYGAYPWSLGPGTRFICAMKEEWKTK